MLGVGPRRPSSEPFRIDIPGRVGWRALVWSGYYVGAHPQGFPKTGDYSYRDLETALAEVAHDGALVQVENARHKASWLHLVGLWGYFHRRE